MVEPVVGARGAPTIADVVGAGSDRRAVPTGAVVAGSVVAGAVVAWWWRPVSAAVVASVVVLALAARIDVREQRLPDRLVAAAAAPVVLAVVTSAEAVGGVVAGAAAVGLPLLVLHLVSPASLGFGDVKAGVVMGAALGLVDWRLGVVALCVASGGTAVWGLTRRQVVVPLGPGLVGGAVVALALARLAGLPWP